MKIAHITHDSKQGERVAGWVHLSFVALYILALAFHIDGAYEHFKRAETKQ